MPHNIHNLNLSIYLSSVDWLHACSWLLRYHNYSRLDNLLYIYILEYLHLVQWAAEESERGLALREFEPGCMRWWLTEEIGTELIFVIGVEAGVQFWQQGLRSLLVVIVLLLMTCIPFLVPFIYYCY